MSTVQTTHNDIAIIGGGIAGLSLAIQCARAGINTVVFEKGTYPRHKVCGEYISHESTPFLQELGIPVDEMQLPQIDTFRLTSHHGISKECKLQPGGFGLSRFTLDHLLAKEAMRLGVTLKSGTRVTDVRGTLSEGYEVHTNQSTSERFKLAVGAWGRQSFVSAKREEKTKNAWIGIKYHVDAGPAEDTIEIHAFPKGYAGISMVEEGKFCLAYLCRADALKASGNDIARLEEEILSSNPYLAKRLSARKLEGPIATSRLTFGVGAQGDLSTLGDAAGFIPPLTGNGMSLALRGSKRMFATISHLMEGKLDEQAYHQQIETYKNTYLRRRIIQGEFLQNFLIIKPDWLNALMLKAIVHTPFALKKMTTLAVGKTI